MVWGAIAGAADHAAGSVDESIGRQFDDTKGGGFADLSETGDSNQDEEPTSQTASETDDGGQYSGDKNGTSTWGDGSNDWVGGFEDFASDPGQLATDPYDTVAGAADAAALNFDEGVGGLSTFADDEAGNTAGPGQSAALTWLPGAEQQEGQPDNPGTTGSPLIDKGFQLVIGLVVIYVIVTLGGPTLGIVENVTES